MKDKQRIKTVALCGIFSAVELALLYLSSVFQVLDLSIAGLTLAFTIVLSVEYGKKPPVFVYLAVSVLSILIVPNKFTPLCYIFFFGLYPIVKPLLEKPKKIIAYVIKLLYFNVFYLILYFLVSHFMLLDDIFGFGTLMFFVLLGVANFAFLLIDYVITVFTNLYRFKLRKKFGLDKLFR